MKKLQEVLTRLTVISFIASGWLSVTTTIFDKVEGYLAVFLSAVIAFGAFIAFASVFEKHRNFDE